MAMVVNETKLNAAMTATADAIREKLGSEEAIPFDYNGGTGFADAVEAIPQGGGDDPDMTVTANQVKILIYLAYQVPVNVAYYQTVSNGVEVDFGDGTVLSSEITDKNYPYQSALVSHEYATLGQHLITITVKSGTMTICGANSPGSGLLKTPYGTGNDLYAQYLAQEYKRMAREIAIGDNIVIDNIAQFPALDKLNRIIQDGKIATVQGTRMPIVIIPEEVSIINAYHFNACIVDTYVLPSTLKELKDRAFTNNYYTRLYDFTSIALVNGELPFTVANVQVFQNINASASLLFKDAETAEVAKTTTNLTPYAAYIHYVGE